ncbi:MAG TPA: hypothetical protein DEQ74_00210 [Wolbachia sp.]|uniref:ankyrin repeat domain-containing protein n=1 Tax=Wolbachia endosymbiont of Pentalonia nigronervosa TaxID=1301914 RepID=UPI000EDF7421|nr:ankyrin repeat domain-containing protein [Wolbachia endosymbiont of Pentalonia nigronervosa]MBD0391769.1 ankyrin repeat domain-containing protein [Wolbachia endosymbiont of Pentalonia nigronervosa]HCE59250.1 hypothetical protein [Wolbachia sp.]
MTTEKRLHALNIDPHLDKDSVFKRMQDAVGIKLSDVNSPFKLINFYYKDSLYADVATFEKCTLLHVATLFNCHRLAELLIERGADVNSKDARGRTPLHYAAIQGHIEVAKVFINKGACIVSQDCSNRTPYYYALKYNHPEIASLIDDHIKSTKLLIDKGADQSCLRTMNPNKANKAFDMICKFTVVTGVAITLGLLGSFLLLSDPYILGALLLSGFIIASIIVGAAVICGTICRAMYTWSKYALSSKLAEVSCDAAYSHSPQPAAG